ncbi:hypothetical protein L4174_022125 [Photobacterium sp. CCB-ST2H9]|uniref:hypothetical protein n=1 Tax=unclassified Photobacterium TaxID=2628852 RepID=UPI002003D23A|nr:hypothetical protein [Photobacterium sp. CCB-ST2H9]UTM59399.1 hypothetical protein L4174_022125 [Photobacterium sp. CCB-ST2H9]
MSVPAKDIDAIYASYKMPHHDYIEMTENETYTNAKRKWLIFRGDSLMPVSSQSGAEPQRRHSRQPGVAKAL